MLKIGIVQMQSTALKVDRNIKTAEKFIMRVVKDGAQLVVLPEVFNSGFFLGEPLMMVAETLEGRTVNWLVKQASRHNIYIISSIYERFDGHFYNTMVMACKDGLVGYYRKRNPTMSELIVWRRADVPGPGIFDTPLGRIGGAICFDSFGRESFEGFQKSGVDLVVVVGCWGFPRQANRRPEALLAIPALRKWGFIASEIMPYQYATTLNVPAVFVNQGGVVNMPGPIPFPSWPLLNTEFEFTGRSNIRNAKGEIIAGASGNETDFYAVAEVNVKKKNIYPEISRSDMKQNYLSSGYYFVQPPYPIKLFQYWYVRGMPVHYEACRLRHQD